MKQLLTILLFLCSIGVFAQDVIVKKDGSTVVCRVVEVKASEITYKLWSDLKGSSYIIDKSLVSAINYESGKKEAFGETQSLYLPNNQNDGVQAMNDKALLKLDWAANNPYKKVKWLKAIGWISGGLLTVAGIGSIAFGCSGGFDYGADGCIAAGIGGVAVGAGIVTLCLVKAHKQKKKIDAALQTSSIYRYDIPLSNGSSFSVGADLLHDRILNNRTVGLGLSYNF